MDWLKEKWNVPLEMEDSWIYNGFKLTLVGGLKLDFNGP